MEYNEKQLLIIFIIGVVCTIIVFVLTALSLVSLFISITNEYILS